MHSASRLFFDCSLALINDGLPTFFAFWIQPVSWRSLSSCDTMLASRGGSGSRYWLAAITCFCIFYWILKAERRTLGSSSTWKSTLYHEISAISAHADHDFAEDGHDASSPAEHTDLPPISKTHPQPTSSLSDGFPKLIWQTSNAEGVERWANETATWTKKNREWKYNLLSGQSVHNISLVVPSLIPMTVQMKAQQRSCTRTSATGLR